MNAHATRCPTSSSGAAIESQIARRTGRSSKRDAERGNEKEHAAERREKSDAESTQQRGNDRRAEDRRSPHRFGALGLASDGGAVAASDGEDECAADRMAVCGHDVPDDANGSRPDVTGRRDENVRVVRIVGDRQRDVRPSARTMDTCATSGSTGSLNSSRRLAGGRRECAFAAGCDETSVTCALATE